MIAFDPNMEHENTRCTAVVCLKKKSARELSARQQSSREKMIGLDPNMET